MWLSSRNPWSSFSALKGTTARLARDCNSFESLAPASRTPYVCHVPNAAGGWPWKADR